MRKKKDRGGKVKILEGEILKNKCKHTKKY